MAYSLNDKPHSRGYGIYFGQAFYPGWNAGMNLDGFNLDDIVNQVRTEILALLPFSSAIRIHAVQCWGRQANTSITSGADNGLSPMYRPQDANHRPYSSQWNLTVERELPHNFFFSASYVEEGYTPALAKGPINVINRTASNTNNSLLHRSPFTPLPTRCILHHRGHSAEGGLHST